MSGNLPPRRTHLVGGVLLGDNLGTLPMRISRGSMVSSFGLDKQDDTCAIRNSASQRINLRGVEGERKGAGPRGGEGERLG